MCCSNSNSVADRQSECGCHCGAAHAGLHFRRRFISPNEEKMILENYSTELQNELSGVEARLKELEGK